MRNSLTVRRRTGPPVNGLHFHSQTTKRKTLETGIQNKPREKTTTEVADVHHDSVIYYFFFFFLLLHNTKVNRLIELPNMAHCQWASIITVRPGISNSPGSLLEINCMRSGNVTPPHLDRKSLGSSDTSDYDLNQER